MEPTDAVRKPEVDMTRSTVMTDTQEQDTNTIPPQMPEELNEQDMQAVNSGAPTYYDIPHLGRVMSSSSESSFAKLKNWWKGRPTADKAEAAAIGTGTATSFTVGLGAGAIENKL